MNKDWIMKRNRRKHPSRAVSSNKKEDQSMAIESSTAKSTTRRLRADTATERSSSKREGNDGYYNECVICDLGGDLLCCDSCPRTYHIECLKPPLKKIPNGKWLCPQCWQKNDAAKPLNQLDSIAKRARTKSIKRKSSSSQSERSSHSSIISGEQLPIKGKSGSTEVNRVLEKEVDLSDRKVDIRKPSDMNSSLPGDEDGTCNEIAEDKIDVSLMDGKGERKKRKHRRNNGDGLKKQKIEKLQQNKIVSIKKSPSKMGPHNARSRKSSKTKNRNRVALGFLSKDGKAEKLPKKESRASCNTTDDKSSLSLGHLQVDRVLGCRIHGQNKQPEERSMRETDEDITTDKKRIDSTDCTEKFDNRVNLDDKDSSMEDNDPDKYRERKEKNNENGSVSYEFLVKWVGRSHIHNRWISESDLKSHAKRKLENYKSKYGTAVINICEDRWKQPQRFIDMRVSKEGNREAYVKWTGLAYDECTWESLEEPVLEKSYHLIDLFERFERKASEKDEDLGVKERKNEIVSLTEQPAELRGCLFPHQLEALNWLRRCWYKSKNVILADEMGLGKTVSACAFISSLSFEFKVVKPCLVLVPLSTMPNWLSEFSLWAPLLNVVEYHGGAKARAVIREYEWHGKGAMRSYKFDVLLTSYEMVLADSCYLRGVSWEVLIVDEGHRLKNSESKLFSLLNTFSFQHRVLLTGTPLQNNIGEMYNLLDFLHPSSSFPSFEDKFRDLTTPRKIEELKKLVAPHMLRRLKKDVMRNIPPKTERIVPVELTSIQAEYYRAMLTKNYQILRNIGKGVPQQSMLNIVMQLRKVCNHPYLIPGTEPESGSMEFLHEMRIKASAKLALLHSMLKLLHKEGHRVLIFSQMTKLLDILEDYLNVEFGPKTFERVDGSVSVVDRQTAIARFNSDKSRFVFLLSTRSCGLGINLATADTVIIYDSDFNPHADIQAMNRAHRIGQSNRLLVYRLVVRASVEERILQLAKKKLMLDQLFVNKSGSQKEVEDILRWGTEELFDDSRDDNKREKTICESDGDVKIDLEGKSRRKGGSLGDVYQDKCTDGSGKMKIVWDETAVVKLLDRSNLPGADSDLENDMLGSVKPTEWNEEQQGGGMESPARVTDEKATQSSQNDVRNVTEENEWDRLLRIRWERYQSEEEATLGRGKRLRKVVSYRETYAPHSNEALLSESDDEDERERGPETKEYTAAGRALKEKFTKLRDRQKKRIAERNVPETAKDVGEITRMNASEDGIESSLDPFNPDNLPVLGLYAPNFQRLESSRRSYPRSNGGQNITRRGSEFPSSLSSASRPSHSVAREAQDQELPFLPGKYRFPELPVEDNRLSRFPFSHAAITMTGASHRDFIPNLSLGNQHKGIVGNSIQYTSDVPPPYMPFLHNRKFPPTFNQQDKEHHQSPSSIPNNHLKVLETIMLRTTGSGGVNHFQKNQTRLDPWTEDELDSLWIGVRRHGYGNWEIMLRDPRLKFSKFKTPEYMAARWEEEQRKLLGKPIERSPLFPGISEDMMSRALNGAKFVKPPRFRSHLTDMKLGFNDQASAGPSLRREEQEGKSPCVLDWPSLMSESSREIFPGKSIDGNQALNLPHWLRDAVSGPSPEPSLPPTVSAIAKSVRVIYGKDSTTIPPYEIPEAAPSAPEDPRYSLRKIKKHRSHAPSSSLSLPAQRVDGSGSGQAELLEATCVAEALPLVPSSLEPDQTSSSSPVKGPSESEMSSDGTILDQEH